MTTIRFRLAAALFAVACLVLVGLTGRAADNNSVAASDARLKRDVFFLAGPECEGRGTGQPGNDKAAEYIAEQFKQAGLKPGGVNGTYFQPFRIPRGPAVLGEDNGLTFWGPGGQKIVMKPEEEFQVQGLSASGKVAGRIVFAGYGITVGDRDDYKGLDVAGKVVLVMRGAPKSLGEELRTKVAQIAAKVANAVAHKAAAVLLLNDAESAKDNDTLASFRLTRSGWGTALPVMCISRAAIAHLLPAGKSLKDLEAAQPSDDRARRALYDWTAAVETDVKRTVLKARNVIGFLDGAGPLADETIVVGAHYDHLGKPPIRFGSMERDPVKRNAIHWGADDNASGTTCVMEMARRFGAMKHRQGRRMVFMTFSGEEMGLMGSRFYCDQQPLFDLKKTAAMFNMDMVGRLRPDPKTHLPHLEVDGMDSGQGFQDLVEGLAKKHDITANKMPPFFGRSDHGSFYYAGIPVVFFFTGFHDQYHRPSDTPDLINVEGMRQVVELGQDLLERWTTQPERPVYHRVGTSRTARRPQVRAALNIRPSYAESSDGVLVDAVTPGGAAEKAGLKKGDRLVAIAGVPIRNLSGYMTEMAKQKPGKAIDVTVFRDGHKKTIAVTPQ